MYVHRMGVFRDHSHGGMLFCDHYTTIEAISVAEPNKNNSLHVKLLARMTINIYA